jgi:hypothetical protein
MGVCAFGGDKNLTLLLDESISLNCENHQGLPKIMLKKPPEDGFLRFLKF